MNRNIQKQLNEEKGVDIRLPSTAFFGVSSFDRYSSTTVASQISNQTSPYSQVSLSSNQNLLNGFFTRIALTEIKLPWTMPTVSGRNKQMTIWDDQGSGTWISTTIQCSSGWQDPFTMASSVQASLKGLVDNSFTCIYDPLQHAFVMASNSSTKFYLQPCPQTSMDKSLQNTNRITIFEMMNWQSTSQANAQTSLTSGVPTMLSTQFVDVVCEQLTYNQDVKDADTGTITRDVIARVYLTPDQTTPQVGTSFTYTPQGGSATTAFYTESWVGSEPFQVYRQFAFPKQIKWSPNMPVGNLVFNLYDDQGLPLTTGVPADDKKMGNWNITLLVSEV